MRAKTAFLLLLTAGCGIQVRPQDPSPSGLPPRGIDPNPTPLPSSDPRTAGAGIRTVCRGARLSSDWAMIDYFESSDCPAPDGERYNAARIVRLSTYPRDSEILVCADQRIPKGWLRQGGVEDTDLYYLCRSTARVRPLTERVMRIRRS